jgi:predicted dehydrogenase
MQKYRVGQVGLGPRGVIHAKGFLENRDRFELAALCARDQERLQKGGREFGVKALYTDAESMLADIRPDVLCFVTPPAARLMFFKLAAKYGVKAVAFEKPMATSLKEARAILDICKEHDIKAIVSHQHKYLPSMKKLKEIVVSGDIGEICEIHATTKAWLSQLGTHFMDYILWINEGFHAKSVAGHIHGNGKLNDSHPSPDYLLGEAVMENGVRAFLECGYLSPSHLKHEENYETGYYPVEFWADDRLTVYGSHGYAWAESNGRWAAFTRSSGGEIVGGQGDPWIEQEKVIQAPYLKDLADWLDDSRLVHPCNIGISYHGFEILEGMCLSALDNCRKDMPLEAAGDGDIIERMKKELPAVNLRHF